MRVYLRVPVLVYEGEETRVIRKIENGEKTHEYLESERDPRLGKFSILPTWMQIQEIYTRFTRAGRSRIGIRCKEERAGKR
ncbi:MAG: hypothetical protein QW292_03730 [Candidatus Parvarchaeota archaeon]